MRNGPDKELASAADTTAVMEAPIPMRDCAPQVESLRQRFVALNRSRLEKTRQSLRPRQQDFLTLLPLLFHVNHPSLPCFRGHAVPEGLANYHIDKNTLQLARKYWPSFAPERSHHQQFDIEALFLMGSSGSLAFSRKSDFDIWLCHRPDLTSEQIGQLQAKASSIEKMADEIGLEVHFFLMNAERFRAGETTELSSESSGTAQHLLLLDEFYRTSLWLAGKYPLWWFIPPRDEHRYEDIKQELLAQQALKPIDIIDFGGLPRIPPEEYFGAAVWQIYKGIDSPYKSALKITLMEAYAHNNGIPLSLQFKQRVYQGEDDWQALDPYLMLLETLEDYLGKLNDDTRLEIIRRSFYIKLDLPLSKTQPGDSWRYPVIERLVRRWGWNDTQIALIDGYQEWSVSEVMEERKLLIEHLTRSYQYLSRFVREQGSTSLIEPRDLTILGRKLYVMFKRSPGKIEIINRGIKKDISEDTLSIVQVSDRRKRNHWLLFRGKVPASQVKQHVPLKKTTGLVELAAWSFLNQVCSKGTQKLVIAPEADIDVSDFDHIVGALTRQCSDLKNFQPSNDDLLRPSEPLSATLFLNASHIPMPLLAGKEKRVTSGDTDALHFNDRGHTLVATSELFHITSWREAYSDYQTGMAGLLRQLCDFFSHAIAEDRPRPLPALHVECTTVHVGQRLTTRVRELIGEMENALLDGPQGLERKFIVEAGGKYHLIQREDDRFTVRPYANALLLTRALETNNTRFRPFVLESQSLRRSTLATLAGINTAGAVQVVVAPRDDGMLAYVLDEYGAVFLQRLPRCDTHTALHCYRQVLRGTLADSIEISYYVLQKAPLGQRLQQIPPEAFLDHPLPPLRAQGKLSNGKPVFLFEYQNTRFDSTELGSRIFQHVAQHVRTQAGKLLISSVHIDPALVKAKDSRHVTTLQILKYKRLFEERLGMARIS